MYFLFLIFHNITFVLKLVSSKMNSFVLVHERWKTFFSPNTYYVYYSDVLPDPKFLYFFTKYFYHFITNSNDWCSLNGVIESTQYFNWL